MPGTPGPLFVGRGGLQPGIGPRRIQRGPPPPAHALSLLRRRASAPPTGVPALCQNAERRAEHRSFARAHPPEGADGGSGRPRRGRTAALSQAPPSSPAPLLSEPHALRGPGSGIRDARRKAAGDDGWGGSVIAVEGEAGVGKTRLAEEFLGYARSQGVRVLSGRCYERELGPPLEPVTEALGPVVDVDEVISGASGRHVEEIGYLWTAKAYNVTRIYHTLTRELVRES